MRKLGSAALVVAAVLLGSAGALTVPLFAGPVSGDAATEPGVFSIRIDQPEAASAARELAARGARVVAWLPPSTLVVVGTGPGLEGLEAETWTGGQALSSALASVHPAQLKTRGSEAGIIAAAASGPALVRIADRLVAAGAELAWLDQHSSLPQLGARLDETVLESVRQALRSSSGLVWADIQSGARLRNFHSALLCLSGEPGALVVHDKGLQGEGQIVGIMDTGLDVDSCFFWDSDAGEPAINDDRGTAVDLGQRKVLAVDFYWAADWPDPQVWEWDDHGHGTHVAGSVAGDNFWDGRHQGMDGMAPSARLVIQDGGYRVDPCADLPGLGCPVRNLEPVLAQAYAQGARIHTNSWGDEENFTPHNRYTERTADVDRFYWEHKDMLVFIAAGNAGSGAGTVGSPATGKNVVAVGATEHGNTVPLCVAGFSSRGWTHDGRIKPDVVVPGQAVVSAGSDHSVATGNCSLATLTGTSMATPTAAGLGALVRQYYVEGFHPTGAAVPAHGFEPSAALVKATLIASAVDLGDVGCSSVQPIPSRDQGWGLVQLDRGLAFAGDPEALVAEDHREGFASGADPAVERTVLVPEDGPLKVVLVWTDPPSSSLAATNLVNDLDLVVTGPDGVFLGNALHDGRSVVVGSPDRLNNVEVVWLPEAAAGRWTVAVAPHVVNIPAQDFALVMVGSVASPGPRSGGRRVRP